MRRMGCLGETAPPRRQPEVIAGLTVEQGGALVR
jgi:hypothetical protein